MAGTGSNIGIPFSFSPNITAEPEVGAPSPPDCLNVLYRNQSSTTHVTELEVLLVTEITFQHKPLDAFAIQSPTTISKPLNVKSSRVKCDPCV